MRISADINVVLIAFFILEKHSGGYMDEIYMRNNLKVRGKNKCLYDMSDFIHGYFIQLCDENITRIKSYSTKNKKQGIGIFWGEICFYLNDKLIINIKKKKRSHNNTV